MTEKNKSFSLFTTDVVGTMGKRNRCAADGPQFAVIPAGGSAVGPSDKGRERRHRDAVARFMRVCRDAEVSAKIDRAVELMERLAAHRSRPVPDAPGAGPSLQELLAMYQPSTDEMEAQRCVSCDSERVCAESEAAYAARNPHRQKQRKDKAQWWVEEKVTKPIDFFADASAPLTTERKARSFEAVCRESAAAYAARNPHKGGL